MSVGSKVVLLVSCGFIGLLIWYYGGTPPTGVVAAVPDSQIVHKSPSVGAPTTGQAPAVPAAPPVPAHRGGSRLVPVSPEAGEYPPPSKITTEVTMGEPLTKPRTGRPVVSTPADPAPISLTPRPTATPRQRESFPAAGVHTHLVQPGDTLSEIAQHYLGSHRDWVLIVSANPGLDENTLRVGKSITIPARAPRSTVQTRVVPTQIPAGSRQHTVIDGDSLSTIADRYYGHEKHWLRVFEANRATLGGDPDRLRLGMVLVVPR
jgi:nucleoid-associated protein YgaU